VRDCKRRQSNKSVMLLTWLVHQDMLPSKTHTGRKFKMLKGSYADVVQKLNIMPIGTDTLEMCNRKMELEKNLDEV
jgi:hypothetical protein